MSLYIRYLGCIRPRKYTVEWLPTVNIDKKNVNKENLPFCLMKLKKEINSMIRGSNTNNQVAS